MPTPDLPDEDLTAAALHRAVNGAFVLKREIGRGGMGVVYLAHDEKLLRDVAIKTLPPHLARDAQVRSRFLREARTAAALSHPNIVPIYSAAEQDGVVYFAMGYVDGESLAERIARTGPLSPDDVVALLDQLAAALGAAHARGVVHRDVKAENVLLDAETGRAMVTDFGIARVTETQPLTATGTVLGTVHYMSPEQVSGDPLDGRSDLYSLGVLAFFALTGRFPFERSTASAVVVAHVNAPAPRVSSLVSHVPPVLDSLVAKLLAKSPGDRYTDAEALRAALQTPDFHQHHTHEVREVGIPGTSGTARVLLSSAEAAEVWSRAADLQANTGALIPPAVFSPRGNEPLVTQGYDASLVKASAVEAGIDEKYVERAMQERQAMAVKSRNDASAAAVAVRRDAMPTTPHVVLGAPLALEYRATLDGELRSEAFEDIADEVRQTFGDAVTVSAVGSTLTVNTAWGQNRGMRFVQMHVQSRNKQTTLRVTENLTQLAGGLYLGLGVGGGIAGGVLTAGLMVNATHSPGLAIGSLVGVLSIAYSLSRWLYLREVKKRDAGLRALLERVVERAQG